MRKKIKVRGQELEQITIRSLKRILKSGKEVEPVTPPMSIPAWDGLGCGGCDQCYEYEEGGNTFESCYKVDEVEKKYGKHLEGMSEVESLEMALHTDSSYRFPKRTNAFMMRETEQGCDVNWRGLLVRDKKHLVSFYEIK